MINYFNNCNLLLIALGRTVICTERVLIRDGRLFLFGHKHLIAIRHLNEQHSVQGGDREMCRHYEPLSFTKKEISKPFSYLLFRPTLEHCDYHR